MKLIQDLGTRRVGKSKRRFGLFECPTCKEIKEKRFDSVKATHGEQCVACCSRHRFTKHKECNTKLYGVWGSMKHRAVTTSIKRYENISICEEWKEWKNFKKWAMNSGYEEGLSIDRIDNNGNYEPSNCRWVTPAIQNQNTRTIISTNTSGYRGICTHKGRDYYYSIITHNKKRINLGRFKTKEEAAIAYNNYVIENKTYHPLNKI